MKSKIITLSAISAGLVAICLTIGAYIQFADLFALVVSSVFVILPLYYKSYKGSFLCYLVGGVIAFIFYGFNPFTVVFPLYFFFFGIYPIIKNLLKEKNINKTLSLIICIVWSVLCLYLAYFYYTYVMGLDLKDFPEYLNFLNDYIIIVVGVVGVVFGFVYDRYLFIVKFVIDRYLQKIIK